MAKTLGLLKIHKWILSNKVQASGLKVQGSSIRVQEANIDEYSIGRNTCGFIPCGLCLEPCGLYLGP
jgi:hypothetical protein